MLMPAMLLCFGAGLLTYSQAVELSPVTAFIPVANVALAMRDVLAGQIVAPLVALTSLASLFWAWLILRWVTQQLSSEEMILGFDPEPLFARTRGGRRRATMLALAVTVLVYFYAGSLVQTRLGVRGVLLSLWVLLPLLGLTAWRFVAPSASLRSLVSLRLPGAAAWPAVVLLALGTLLPMMGGYMRLQELALPSPSSGLAEMEALFSDLSLWQVFLLGSLSPAICEEFVFRGVFLGLLRRFGKPRAAVVTTAVFFGLIHLSVFRFVPTAALGLILALLVVRTGSILPSMLFHAVYNGSLLWGGAWVAEHGAPIDLQGPLAWALSLFALVGGAILLRGVRTPE
jgi:sodium transport system permease protein